MVARKLSQPCRRVGGQAQLAVEGRFLIRLGLKRSDNGLGLCGDFRRRVELRLRQWPNFCQGGANVPVPAQQSPFFDAFMTRCRENVLRTGGAAITRHDDIQVCPVHELAKVDTGQRDTAE